MRKIKNKFLLIFLILISALFLAFFITRPLYEQTIPSSFIAGENMGFDLDAGKLNFGKIIPGSSGARKITITNYFYKPTITKIESSGEISSCIVVSENNFILQSKESKNITFSCFPEVGIELKEYAGQITITTKKVNFF